jgi:hypothetical protein
VVGKDFRDMSMTTAVCAVRLAEVERESSNACATTKGGTTCHTEVTAD